MFSTRRNATVLLLAWLLGWAAPGQASVVLFDNLDEPGDFFHSVTNDDWLAQGFRTTATAAQVTAVAVALSNQQATTGTFALEIWNVLSGKPGALVQSVFAGDTAALTGTPFEVTGLALDLTPATDYFLVVRGVTLDAFGGLDWFYADGTGGIGLPSAYAISTDGGANWSDPSSDAPQRMRITAADPVPADPVPLPATVALLALGLVGLRATRRRWQAR